MAFQVLREQPSLPRGCETGADEPYPVFESLNVDDADETTIDGADRDVSVLIQAVLSVVDLQVVRRTEEQRAGLLEGEAVLLLVEPGLAWILL